MAFLIGTVTAVSVAKDGWSAWVTLEGLGRAGSSLTYDLNTAIRPMLSLSVTDASGAIREVLATRVVRKPFPEENELDHKIVGDDLVVRVALSEFVFSTSQAIAFAEEHWASTILDGQSVSSLAAQQVPVENFSEISADDAAPIANFVTPDRQLVGETIHVEVIAGSIFANAGAEVASVRFVARDQHGNEVEVQVDASTLSAWGKGDARPVYSYGADIPTTGLTDGDLITVHAEVTDQIGNIRVSAPNGSIPANPTAFTDQIYLLDADGSFGKAYAYVDSSVAIGSGVANADPMLAATTPFKTIAAAMTATQVFNQVNFGRANLDNAEIRLKAGTHVWVNGSLTSQQASTDDVWLTITRDPAATIEEVRLTGAIDGKNSFAVADHIKIEGLTIDRAPMGSSLAAIMRGQSNDSLWLHDVVFEGGGQRTVSFQIPDIWVTQSDFNGTSRALSTFGTDINMFRIRGIEADAGAGNIINGHLLVGSDLHNLAVRYPVTPKTPNANGSVVAYNDISTSTSTQLFALNGVRDVAVIGNVFTAIKGSSPAISISADGATSDISNIVFHNNTVLNERMNVGYNDLFGQNFAKTLISVKWNDVFQLNTKHDVFSADSANTGAWSVLYGVGFESNVVHTKPAGSRGAFGFAYDGGGSSGNGLLPPVPQQDVPDIAPVGSPPVATADNFLASEDSVLDVTAAQGVLANDYDVDGDALTAMLVAGPANGNLTLNTDGSFVYVPLANYHGQDSFSYATAAGIHLSETVTVLITVQAVNDAPFAQDDVGPPSFVGDVVRFSSGELLANDTDSDADTLSLISVQDAANGRVELVDGEVVFFVSVDAAVEASFSYTTSDNQGGFATATVRVPLLVHANQPPVFVSAAATQISENQNAVIRVEAKTPGEVRSLGYSITGGADAALFAIDASTGALSFVAAPNFELPLDADANNLYELVVTASDGGLTTPQAITVTVADVIEVPTQTYTGTALADTFTVSDGNGWTISGRVGNDSLTGGAMADVIIGGQNNDILIGGAGDDTFTFAAGDGMDSYDGGVGFDKIVATTANTIIAISAISGIEAIGSGGFANVSITGTTVADTLDFSGMVLSGITQIDAGAGNDTVFGSAGIDTIVLGSGNDVFRTGNGNDIFIARASAGSDVIDGGAGFDTINAGGINVAITVAALTSIEAINANGFTGVSLIGSTLADVLDFSGTALTGISFIDAGTGNDIVVGSAGNDTIVLGSGTDSLSGGDGDDVFLARASAGLDSVDGGIGYDTVLASAANVSITLASFASVEEISANGFASVMLVGSAAADIMNYAGVTLTGIDSIVGGAGNDTITGSAADDRIHGGTGRDVMTGGLGADTFAFATSAESGLGATRADHITDFLSGTDIIDLTAIDADTSILGDQAFTFIGSAAFTELGQLRIGVDTDGHVALFGNTTGTLTADFQVSFDNNAPLLPADIHL